MSTTNSLPNRYRLCPQCGNFSHVLEEQHFCILCGSKLIDQCTHCGRPILHPQGKFCYHCGSGYRDSLSDRGEQRVA